MKITVKFEIPNPELLRRICRDRDGRPGKATRKEMRRLLRELAYTQLAQLTIQYRRSFYENGATKRDEP